VTIESLVPADHLLRKIDAVIDLEFIRERVRHLYCESNGRPALDPVVLFKLLLIGYPFGIRSERQPMREVQCNAAHRWFLRLDTHYATIGLPATAYLAVLLTTP
jgi:transposase